jgi:hypothetical protein
VCVCVSCVCACVCMYVKMCVWCEGGHFLLDVKVEVEVTYRPLMNARSTSPTDVGSSSDTSHPMRVTTLGSLCTTAWYRSIASPNSCT